MNIDLKSLRKLESLPTAQVADGDAPLLVLVKLRDGAACPDYVTLRAGVSACMFSAEITAATLCRLEADDAVESVAVSRVLPGVR
jgi:hypothetical protein